MSTWGVSPVARIPRPPTLPPTTPYTPSNPGGGFWSNGEWSPYSPWPNSPWKGPPQSSPFSPASSPIVSPAVSAKASPTNPPKTSNAGEKPSWKESTPNKRLRSQIAEITKGKKKIWGPPARLDTCKPDGTTKRTVEPRRFELNKIDMLTCKKEFEATKGEDMRTREPWVPSKTHLWRGNLSEVGDEEVDPHDLIVQEPSQVDTDVWLKAYRSEQSVSLEVIHAVQTSNNNEKPIPSEKTERITIGYNEYPEADVAWQTVGAFPMPACGSFVTVYVVQPLPPAAQGGYTKRTDGDDHYYVIRMRQLAPAQLRVMGQDPENCPGVIKDEYGTKTEVFFVDSICGRSVERYRNNIESDHECVLLEREIYGESEMPGTGDVVLRWIEGIKQEDLEPIFSDIKLDN